MGNDDTLPVETGSHLTRRQLMTYGARGAALLGAGSLLSACGAAAGAGGTTAGTTLSGAGKPVRGGTLKVGMIGAGSAETLDPGIAVTNTDFLRVANLFDYLMMPAPGNELGNLEPRLATSAEPNKDATSWILKLRQGVTWHDGKPFTADDVVWTVKSWGSEENYAYGFTKQFIDFKHVRKHDSHTVEIPLVRPTAEFPTLLSLGNLAVIQNGATRETLGSNPIGTGPFKFVSFKPGYQSVFAPNQNYWEHGGPYVDELIVNSSFQDETARYNALLGGQIDVSSVFPANFAHEQQSAQQVNLLDSPGAGGMGFSMLLTKPPFNDPRVVEAMKLMCDREALIEGVMPGFGTVANDIMGRYTAHYDESLKSEFDVEKAKSLLKAAGQENLTITLPTSSVQPGFNEAAALYAQQASAAGVTINVEPVSAATYYTASGGFLTRSFGETYFGATGSLTALCSMAFLTNSAYPETGWADQPGGGNQKLMGEAMAEQDPRRAGELWREVQTEWFEKDGHVFWSYPNNVDAAAKNVAGLSSGPYLYLRNYRLSNAWFTS